MLLAVRRGRLNSGMPGIRDEHFVRSCRVAVIAVRFLVVKKKQICWQIARQGGA